MQKWDQLFVQYLNFFNDSLVSFTVFLGEDPANSRVNDQHFQNNELRPL